MNNRILTIKRDINVDIDQLAKAYEKNMKGMLYSRLRDLNLSSDDADYICSDDTLSEEILNLVKFVIAKKFL